MKRLIAATALFLAMAALARAHFVFIVPPTKDGEKITVVFSDSTKPDKAEYLKKIENTKFHAVDAKGQTTEVKSKTADKVLEIESPAKGTTCIIGATSYGVFDKKDPPFLLTYYSRAVLSK